MYSVSRLCGAELGGAQVADSRGSAPPPEHQMDRPVRVVCLLCLGIDPNKGYTEFGGELCRWATPKGGIVRYICTTAFTWEPFSYKCLGRHLLEPQLKQRDDSFELVLRGYGWKGEARNDGRKGATALRYIQNVAPH